LHLLLVVSLLVRGCRFVHTLIRTHFFQSFRTNPRYFKNDNWNTPISKMDNSKIDIWNMTLENKEDSTWPSPEGTFSIWSGSKSFL